MLDASGCFVSPGWIDLHAHVYQHATELGVDADERCLYRGGAGVVVVAVAAEAAATEVDPKQVLLLLLLLLRFGVIVATFPKVV